MEERNDPYTLIGRIIEPMLTGRAIGRKERREFLLRLLPPLSPEEQHEFSYHFIDGD